MQALKFSFVFLLILSLLDSVCSASEYYIGFVNKTGHRLGAVSAYYGDKEAASAGGLVVSGKATYGPVTMQFPSEVEVRWIDNGERNVVKVKLNGIPKGFGDGTVYFIIKADGAVDLKTVKLDDILGNASVTK